MNLKPHVGIIYGNHRAGNAKHYIHHSPAENFSNAASSDFSKFLSTLSIIDLRGLVLHGDWALSGF